MIEASREPKTFGFKNALRNSNLHETGGAQSFSKPPRFLSPHRKSVRAYAKGGSQRTIVSMAKDRGREILC